MKINRPVRTLPPHTGSTHAKYADAYLAAGKLRAGEWLPVEFNNAHEAYNFRVSVATHRKKLMEAVLRGSVVYIRNKVGTNGTKGVVGK